MEEVCACSLLGGLGSRWYILSLLGDYVRTCVLMCECHVSVVTVHTSLGERGCGQDQGIWLTKKLVDQVGGWARGGSLQAEGLCVSINV